MITLVHAAAGGAYGGTERMLVALAGAPHPALAQHFVLSLPGRLERELLAAGATVHKLPSPRAARALMIWRARRAFASVLDALSPDAVIFHGEWPHAMFAASARAAGARVGFWQHQPLARPAWPDRRAWSAPPDFTIFNSAFTRARPAFPDVPGPVIGCPVSPPPRLSAGARTQLRQDLGAREDHVVVLVAGGFGRWTGHDVLLDAAQALPRDAGIRIWIAGGAGPSGERANRQRPLSLPAELNNLVSLLGDRNDVPALMRAADVYCQPSLRGEPFGIAIAEAMLAGLPCVVSAPGGASQLLDRTCGVVTQPGDPLALAAALRRLAADPARRAAMGRSAVARASQLTDVRARLEDLMAVLRADAR